MPAFGLARSAAYQPVYRSVDLPGRDLVPDAFSFTDQTSVPLSSVIISSPITLAGLTGSATITVTGGDYSLNGGAFTSWPGLVGYGDQIRARHTSASVPLTATDTVITVGGVSDTFRSTTLV